MAKNLFDIRFGIKRPDGYTSKIWRLWITRIGDVYLCTKGMGGIIKYSFHKSGICRHAFTKEHGIPNTLTDRATIKWKKADTLPKGNGQASRVAWLSFPTDYLSRDIDVGKKKITWINAAPVGKSTFLEMCYTNEDKESILNAFQNNGRKLVSFTNLPNNEKFIINYYYHEWDNNDLKSPATDGSTFPDLLFSENDPKDTGRPVRIHGGPSPKDGDSLQITELGGYRI